MAAKKKLLTPKKKFIEKQQLSLDAIEQLIDGTTFEINHPLTPLRNKPVTRAEFDRLTNSMQFAFEGVENSLSQLRRLEERLEKVDLEKIKLAYAHTFEIGDRLTKLESHLDSTIKANVLINQGQDAKIEKLESQVAENDATCRVHCKALGDMGRDILTRLDKLESWELFNEHLEDRLAAVERELADLKSLPHYRGEFENLPTESDYVELRSPGSALITGKFVLRDGWNKQQPPAAPPSDKWSNTTVIGTIPASHVHNHGVGEHKAEPCIAVERTIAERVARDWQPPAAPPSEKQFIGTGDRMSSDLPLVNGIPWGTKQPAAPQPVSYEFRYEADIVHPDTSFVDFVSLPVETFPQRVIDVPTQSPRRSISAEQLMKWVSEPQVLDPRLPLGKSFVSDEKTKNKAFGFSYVHLAARLNEFFNGGK